MGAIDTGTIESSFMVTIFSTMAMTTPNISYMSTMDSGIGLLESSKFRANMITTAFLAFAAISTRRVAVIICSLSRLCVSATLWVADANMIKYLDAGCMPG